MERRLNEAARRGFVRAIVPPGLPAVPPGIELVVVRELAEAVATAFVAPVGAR
jgi:predicted ATP-dependent serine protease